MGPTWAGFFIKLNNRERQQWYTVILLKYAEFAMHAGKPTGEKKNIG